MTFAGGSVDFGKFVLISKTLLDIAAAMWFVFEKPALGMMFFGLAIADLGILWVSA
jgi:hypothetical protein